MAEEKTKVKLLKARVINGSVEPGGKIVELPSAKARAWIRAGVAESVKESAAPVKKAE